MQSTDGETASKAEDMVDRPYRLQPSHERTVFVARVRARAIAMQASDGLSQIIRVQ
jgi:hypothetical protein